MLNVQIIYGIRSSKMFRFPYGNLFVESKMILGRPDEGIHFYD